MGAAGLGFLLSLSACGPSNQELTGVRVQIPWTGADGRYSLQVVELKTLRKVSTFEGDAAQVRVDPFNASGDRHLMTPHFRYFKSRDGVLVPINLESLQMATAYAHMERLMEMDQRVGTYAVLKWPRWIGILKEQSKTTDGDRITNNAYYFSPKDMIVLAPYERSDLPMTMNGGIIAHEHFHAIFQSLVLTELKWASKGLLETGMDLHVEDSAGPDGSSDAKGKPKRSSRAAPKASEPKNQDGEAVQKRVPPEELNDKVNIVLVRALNEGLADVWGWFYSGNENFIEPSLREITNERTLSSSSKVMSNGIMPTDAYLRARIEARMIAQEKEKGWTTRLSYAVGTYFSRLMRNVYLASRKKGTETFKLSDRAEDTAAEEREEWAKVLVRVLPKLREGIQKKVASKEALSVNFLAEVIEKELEITPSVCETLRHFWLEEPAEKDRERLCPEPRIEQKPEQRPEKEGAQK